MGIRVEQWSLGPLSSPQSLEGRVTLVSQVGLRLTWRGPGRPRLRAGSLACSLLVASGLLPCAPCPARGPGLTALEMPGRHAWGPVPPASSASGFPDRPLHCLPSRGRPAGVLGSGDTCVKNTGPAPRAAQRRPQAGLPPRPGSAPLASRRLLGGEEPSIQPFKLLYREGRGRPCASDLSMQLRSHLSCPEKVKVWRLCFSLKMVVPLLSTLPAHGPGAPVLGGLLRPLPRRKA